MTTTKKDAQESVTREEYEAMKAELEAKLVIANKAKHDKLSFRSEKCKTANSFHISLNSLFDAVAIRQEFDNLFIEHDDEQNCDVYKRELRDSLIAKLKQ